MNVLYVLKVQDIDEGEYENGGGKNKNLDIVKGESKVRVVIEFFF